MKIPMIAILYITGWLFAQRGSIVEYWDDSNDSDYSDNKSMPKLRKGIIVIIHI